MKTPVKTFRMPLWLNRHLKSKERKFAEASVLMDLVIQKKAPGLLVCGNPGTGKSRLARERFDAAGMLEDFHYRIVKGHGSALGLYSLLYECREMILVLDDADSLFEEANATNLLKAALDSGEQVRRISWQSQSARQMDMPMSFVFKGAVIFISNLTESEMDTAVLSRSFHYNLELSADEILATMYKLLVKVEPQVPMAEKAEALEFIKENREELEAGGRFNLRTLTNGIRIRTCGTPMWKELVRKCA